MPTNNIILSNWKLLKNQNLRVFLCLNLDMETSFSYRGYGIPKKDLSEKKTYDLLKKSKITEILTTSGFELGFSVKY